MTDENNNQPINETPNNQAPETPVVTSVAPENEPQNTTDIPENTGASVPPEKTEPATTPEAPTSEAEQSSQLEKSNANSEEKNSYIIIDSQEEYMQFMAENASSDIINKNVIFKGISWDKKYDDFKKFGVIKFENCNLEGLNTNNIDLNSINIDEHCTNVNCPDGVVIGSDGYLYPEEFIVEQTATRIKGEIELSAEDYREKLDVISNKNILVEYGAEFKGITFTAEDKLDFSNFQGEITFKNCDLSQLRLENIAPNLSCVINVGENVKLPESLPDGWVMHGNQIINKNAQDLDLILAASNDKVFYEPNPKVIKTKKDFEEYAKNLKEDGGIHLENVVIENVEFGEDLDLSMFRNVEFKNCNFEKVKNFVTSSGGYNFKADAKCVGLDGLVEIEQPVKNSKNKSQNSKENSQNKTKQQKNNQDKSDEQPEVSGGAVVRTINRIIKNNAVVKYYESMDGEFIDVTKAFVSGAVSGDSGKEILQAGSEYVLGENNGDKIRAKTKGGQRLFEDVDELIKNAKKTNPGQFINSIQVKVENSKAAKVVNSAKEGLETAKDWTIQRIKSSKVGRTARYLNCKVKRSKCANIVNNNAKQGLEKLANYAKRNQNIKIGLNVMGDVGKFGLKCMPGVSLGIGMESAYENFRDGDYIRGALEFISPWLDFFPPVGTVISAGIDAGLLAYDIYNAVDEGNKEANKKNQEENDNYQMFIEGIKNRFGGKGGGGEDISAEQIKELYEMYKNLSDEEKMAFLNPPERDGSNPEAPLSFENIKNKMQNVIDGKDSYIDKESKKQTNENNPSQPPVQRKSANSKKNQGQSGNPNNNKTVSKNPYKLDKYQQEQAEDYYNEAKRNLDKYTMNKDAKNYFKDDENLKSFIEWCVCRGFTNVASLPEIFQASYYIGGREGISTMGNRVATGLEIVAYHMANELKLSEKECRVIESTLSKNPNAKYYNYNNKKRKITDKYKEANNKARKKIGLSPHGVKSLSYEDFRSTTGGNVNHADDPTLYAMNNRFTARVDARGAEKHLNNYVDSKTNGNTTGENKITPENGVNWMLYNNERTLT